MKRVSLIHIANSSTEHDRYRKVQLFPMHSPKRFLLALSEPKLTILPRPRGRMLGIVMRHTSDKHAKESAERMYDDRYINDQGAN